jgi:hypothetical protein
MRLNRAIEICRRVGRQVFGGCCWVFAPVATSVKGALDRTDWRPIVARVVVIGGAAGAGIREAIKDPEVMGALVVVAIAVLSGFLEALSRANQGPQRSSPEPSLFAEPQAPAARSDNAQHDS